MDGGKAADISRKELLKGFVLQRRKFFLLAAANGCRHAACQQRHGVVIRILRIGRCFGFFGDICQKTGELAQKQIVFQSFLEPGIAAVDAAVSLKRRTKQQKKLTGGLFAAKTAGKTLTEGGDLLIGRQSALGGMGKAKQHHQISAHGTNMA